ncbi:MAG TPA: single-stranded-DNA-specific exonuclease RecJ [Alphaproteobacteria bacterium]|jgi:single-stranded-DNA-specific exonuclease|nr:single-stranded-DNA-specific exonuclease RecJ [Alphaproteobacteria bacterium]
MKWEVLSKSKDIIKTLLKNRKITNSKEFFSPKDPHSIKLKALGIKGSEVKKAIERIKQAKNNKEDVIIYGDYDADGICATAILWESLHKFGLEVLPHIPDRFEEGYGINPKSVENLKLKIPNLKLIVTVDNGIVAYEGIEKAKELEIDVIILDHHQREPKKLPTDYILHTTEVCGSGLAYLFSKELGFGEGLELAAIGTIADQMPLVKINRSIVKYGLQELNKTKRLGLKMLFADAKIEEIGTYEVNYIIAPRLNAMGRLAKGIDSLRLLCTKKDAKAQEFSKLLSKTNTERQSLVDEILTQVLKLVQDSKKIIVIAHENYHEGIIGLAAGKLVEEFYRPAIVLSKKGDISKASARSVSGFNIIEAIKKTELILEGGGHPMAAGFSIKTSNIEKFAKKINALSAELLTDELLTRKLKIDLEVNFSDLTRKLYEELENFNPTGVGNPAPTFATRKVEVVEVKTVGKESKHLKLKLRQNNITFDAIWFNAVYSSPLTVHQLIDIAYNLEDNIWNGNRTLQLKIKDLKII